MEVRRCDDCGRQWPAWRRYVVEEDGWLKHMPYSYGQIDCASCGNSSVSSFESGDGVLVVWEEQDEKRLS